MWKNKKLWIIVCGVVGIISLLVICWMLSQGNEKIQISENEIEYIVLEGTDVQIGDELLSGTIDKRLDGESAKRILVDYMNDLDGLGKYRQGDPIIGTPSFQIKVFLQDGGTIHIEEDGIIVVRDGDDEKWYRAEDSFHTLFMELYEEGVNR